MLLPHGYEGRAPSTRRAGSSGSWSCGDDNMQVVLPDDRGADVPHAPAAGKRNVPQAADRADAQEHAAHADEPGWRSSLAGRSGDHRRPRFRDRRAARGRSPRRSRRSCCAAGRSTTSWPSVARRSGARTSRSSASSSSTRCTTICSRRCWALPREAELRVARRRSPGTWAGTCSSPTRCMHQADRLPRRPVHRAGQRRARRRGRSGATRPSRSRSSARRSGPEQGRTRTTTRPPTSPGRS